MDSLTENPKIELRDKGFGLLREIQDHSELIVGGIQNTERKVNHRCRFSDSIVAKKTLEVKKIYVKGNYHKARKKRDIYVSLEFEVSAKKFMGVMVIGMKRRLRCSKEATRLKLVQTCRSYGTSGDSAGSKDCKENELNRCVWKPGVSVIDRPAELMQKVYESDFHGASQEFYQLGNFIRGSGEVKVKQAQWNGLRSYKIHGILKPKQGLNELYLLRNKFTVMELKVVSQSSLSSCIGVKRTTSSPTETSSKAGFQGYNGVYGFRLRDSRVKNVEEEVSDHDNGVSQSWCHRNFLDFLCRETPYAVFLLNNIQTHHNIKEPEFHANAANIITFVRVVILYSVGLERIICIYGEYHSLRPPETWFNIGHFAGNMNTSLKLGIQCSTSLTLRTRLLEGGSTDKTRIGPRQLLIGPIFCV